MSFLSRVVRRIAVAPRAAAVVSARAAAIRAATGRRGISSARVACAPFKAAYEGGRASGVGVVAMEAYIPRTYVAQEALEEFDKAGKGKYTVGLGQKAMAFVDDREDINSMAMTAVQQL